MFNYRKTSQQVLFSPCETTDFSDARGVFERSSGRVETDGSSTERNVSGKIGNCYEIVSSCTSTYQSVSESFEQSIETVAESMLFSAGIWAKANYTFPSPKGLWMGNQWITITPAVLSIVEIWLGGYVVRIQAKRWTSGATSQGVGYSFSFTNTEDTNVKILRDAFYIGDAIMGDQIYSGSYTLGSWRFLGIERSSKKLLLYVDGTAYEQVEYPARTIVIKTKTKAAIVKNGTYSGNPGESMRITPYANSLFDCINVFGNYGLVEMFYNSGNGAEL